MSLPFDRKKPLLSLRARFPRAVRRVHFFTDERFAYFRPRGAEADWWGVLQESVNPHLLCERNSWELRDARKAVKNGYFFRVFFLPDPREGEERLWQIHWHPQFGFVIPTPQKKNLQGAFFDPPRTRRGQNSLFHAATEDLKRDFLSQWHDPKSDVRAALPFCDQEHETRIWNALEWQRGDLETLKVPMRALLLVEMGRLKSEWGQADLVCSQNRSFWDNGWSFQDVNLDYPAPARLLRETAKRITSQCDARYFWQKTRLHRYLPWGDYMGWWAPSEHYSQAIECESPSFHEIIEAQIQLRGWLETHAPDLLPLWFPNEP